MTNLVIAISGASHSGKTTFIEKLKEKLGNDVLICGEIIRSFKIDINEVRKDASKYFELQKKIISRKIEQEKSSVIFKNKVILFDRSLIDSLYYYMNYIDKSKLTKEEYIEYQIFLSKIISVIENNYYDGIALFNPINVENNIDEYRTNELSFEQKNEFKLIKSLSYGFLNDITFEHNVLRDDVKMFFEKCKNLKLNNLQTGLIKRVINKL